MDFPRVLADGEKIELGSAIRISIRICTIRIDEPDFVIRKNKNSNEGQQDEIQEKKKRIRIRSDGREFEKSQFE